MLRIKPDVKRMKRTTNLIQDIWFLTPIFLDTAELETIRTTLAAQPKLDRIYRVDLTDAADVVHASFEKTIHIRYKDK
ncbi:MAG: hypothetical protein ACE5HM_04190 [Acidiferrobacterales bacterium]